MRASRAEHAISFLLSRRALSRGRKLHPRARKRERERGRVIFVHSRGDSEGFRGGGFQRANDPRFEMEMECKSDSLRLEIDESSLASSPLKGNKPRTRAFIPYRVLILSRIWCSVSQPLLFFLFLSFFFEGREREARSNLNNCFERFYNTTRV